MVQFADVIWMAVVPVDIGVFLGDGYNDALPGDGIVRPESENVIGIAQVSVRGGDYGGTSGVQNCENGISCCEFDPDHSSLSLTIFHGFGLDLSYGHGGCELCHDRSLLQATALCMLSCMHMYRQLLQLIWRT